jgi:hypothetical protein
VTAAEVPVRPGVPRAGRARLTLPGRLLRLEARRNAMLWMLPLIAVLFWLDAYTKYADIGPDFLGVILQHHVFMDVGPFAAGAAAWMGSRDGRRGTADLVSVTARPRWTGRLATWAATAGWTLLAFAGCVAALYESTASQLSWGLAQGWWVAVSGTGVLMCTALGFAAGSFFPSRFTAPLTAACVFFAVPATFQTGYDATGGYALISPVNAPLQPGVFYGYLPDLSIAQVLFLAGLVVALLGALGLPAAAGGRWLRGTAAGVTTIGLVIAGMAFGLAGTARMGTYGVDIPALHDAAADRPIAYTPVCSGSGVPICVHPGYQPTASGVTTALGPVLAQTVGLPGAPVRVDQVAIPLSPQTALLDATVAGSPTELSLPLYWFTSDGPPTADLISQIQAQAGPAIVDSVIDPAAADSGALGGAPAQQAVEAALLEAADVPLVAPNSPAAQADGPPVIIGPAPGTPVYAAARRFAALPATARHTWLTANLTKLRVGRITVEQLP